MENAQVCRKNGIMFSDKIQVQNHNQKVIFWGGGSAWVA